MKAKEFITEKTIFNPDVSWVPLILAPVEQQRQSGDVYELVDLLNDAFAKERIEFDVVNRGSFGRGAFKDTQSANVGLVGAEWQGQDSDPQIIVTITPKAAKLNTLLTDFATRLKQLIKHELIHKEQEAKKGSSLGSSPDAEHLYYADPHEVAAIASEMEDQLLAIEPNKSKLIQMLKTGDKRLLKSPRYKLYYLSYKQDPLYKKAFNRIMRAVISRVKLSV